MSAASPPGGGLVSDTNSKGPLPEKSRFTARFTSATPLWLEQAFDIRLVLAGRDEQSGAVETLQQCIGDIGRAARIGGGGAFRDAGANPGGGVIIFGLAHAILDEPLLLGDGGRDRRAQFAVELTHADAGVDRGMEQGLAAPPMR